MVLHAPDSFQPHLEAMQELTSIHTQMEEVEIIEFVLAFVTQKAEIGQIAPLLAEKANGDLLLWFAYPKKSSKNYQSDINRDDGWTVLGALGFEGVRQVAIDADWSALRFRKIEYIKKFTRRSSMAMTKEGKKRTTNKK